jgi:ADP-ribosylglycohydrolase
LTKFDRKFTALYGLYISDSLAMPSHFITDKNQLIKDYGVIKSFKQPLKKM